MKDFRYAIRMLLKNPGVAAAAIVSLGLGIGANAVIFTWIKAVLLDPLPGIAHQSDLVVVATQTRDGGYVSLSYPDYRDLATGARRRQRRCTSCREMEVPAVEFRHEPARSVRPIVSQYGDIELAKASRVGDGLDAHDLPRRGRATGKPTFAHPWQPA